MHNCLDAQLACSSVMSIIFEHVFDCTLIHDPPRGEGDGPLNIWANLMTSSCLHCKIHLPKHPCLGGRGGGGGGGCVPLQKTHRDHFLRLHHRHHHRMVGRQHWAPPGRAGGCLTGPQRQSSFLPHHSACSQRCLRMSAAWMDAGVLAGLQLVLRPLAPQPDDSGQLTWLRVLRSPSRMVLMILQRTRTRLPGSLHM